jgi:hypothetical protein
MKCGFSNDFPTCEAISMMRLKHCMALLAALLSLMILWLGGQALGQTGQRATVGASQQPVLVGLRPWSEEASQVWLAGAYRPARGWIDDRQARFLLHPGTRFTLYNLRGRLGEVAVGAVESGEEVGGYFAPVRNKRSGKKVRDLNDEEFTPVNYQNDAPPGVLALAGTSHPVVPRLPRAQSLTNNLYRRVVVSLLRAKGLTIAQPRLTQHLRLDLNGDGVEEVLLSAHSRAAMGQEPRALKGDRSVNLVLRGMGR